MIVVAALAPFHALQPDRFVADNLNPNVRKRAMSAVKCTNTAPERMVRSALHQLGYRFRLQNRKLPGRPDLVLARLRLAIFVHGCFWHGHSCRRGNRLPKTNVDYWEKKISGNVARDRRQKQEYRMLEWRVLIIWECQIRRAGFHRWLAKKLRRYDRMP